MKLDIHTTSSIAKASIVLTLLGILSKGIGFFREIIYANNFGLSSEFDLFLTSIAIPAAINTAVIYLCQHYFIPRYNKTKNNYEEGIIFFNNNFWWFIIGGIIVALLMFFFSLLILPLYLNSLPHQLQKLGFTIFLLFLITIPINAGMSVIVSYMQANFNFIYPSFSLIIINSIVIILILFFSELLQILILPISFVIAYLIAFTFLIISVKRDLKLNFKSLFRFNSKLSELNIIISLIFIEGLSLSYIIIDRFFIGNVSTGGIAALNYAFVIFSLPISLFSLPLITTTFSKFSNTVYNSPKRLGLELNNTIRINFYIMIPFLFILFIWGNIFLQLFYERGKFSSADTLLTFSVLKHYTVGLVFITTYYIFVKVLYSINKYTSILLISILAFLLKIFFSYLLVQQLEQDGLALSTSLVYLVLFFLGFVTVIKNLKTPLIQFLFSILSYFFLSGIFSFIIINYLSSIIEINPLFTELFKVAMFITIYILNSKLMNDFEFNLIKKTIFGFIKR